MTLSRSPLGAAGARVGGESLAELQAGGFAVSLAPLPSSSSCGAAQAACSAAAVGPASYSPRRALTQAASPATRFGAAPRFQSSATAYISPRHNSDLLCTASPGPKYALPRADVTLPRAPALGWGEPPAARDRADRSARAVLIGESVGCAAGPADYTPRLAAVKPSAPAVGFGRSERFASGGFGSFTPQAHASADAPMLLPNAAAVLPQSPRFSFGTPREPGRATHAAPMRDRTSFMTHSIRGGLAKPATLECNVGPSDYDVRAGDIASRVSAAARSAPASARTGFGSAPRFLKPGVEFLSAAHAATQAGHSSPGCKYAPTGHTIAAAVNKGQKPSAIRWTP